MLKPFVTLEEITLRLKDHFIFSEISWEIMSGQNWAVIGPNGSGKSALVGAIAGDVPVVKGRISRHFVEPVRDAIGYVSFGIHQRIIEREESKDEARYFSGQLYSYDTAREIMFSRCRDGRVSMDTVDELLARLGIKHIVDRPVRFLSTGEMRKVVIAISLLKFPRLLILDEPYDGLDHKSKDKLKESITNITDNGTQVILVTHRFEEITDNITHIMCLKNGEVFAQGTHEEIVTKNLMTRLYDRSTDQEPAFSKSARQKNGRENEQQETLVRMQEATVEYEDHIILDNVTWTMKSGQNWAVIGPNGAGKTTLLSLITGENPQVYANDVYLFGKQRGTGESIWEIKEKIGIVSSEFQIHYRKQMNVLDVILSGYFDSIGLYRYATKAQIERAIEWINRLGISYLQSRRFDRISDGEKRMVLVARSMVKDPLLLILDEPCQGLDPANRKTVLELIDHIGHNFTTSLIYVTHNAHEIVSCITHILRLDRQTAKISHNTGSAAP
jgi:molybdate transport system ATP-binding protein